MILHNSNSFTVIVLSVRKWQDSSEVIISINKLIISAVYLCDICKKAPEDWVYFPAHTGAADIIQYDSSHPEPRAPQIQSRRITQKNNGTTQRDQVQLSSPDLVHIQ